MADILLVTDRTDDIMGLVSGLEEAGHRVGVSSFDEFPGSGPEPNFVLVDSVKDFSRGREHCKRSRSSGGSARIVAILAPSALDAMGPDWEVDTFIVDGCGVEEMLARLRLASGPQAAEDASIIRVGELMIDPDTYQVRLRGRPLDLTYKEFQLLSFLAQRPGRVFSRSLLLQEVWGYDFFGGTRTVDVHVRRLRAKLGAEHESMIATVRNVGYKMEVASRASRGSQ
ncbi:MAG: winged helix-turn-helix transcriptional regulator [Actinomycetota bacterium]